jgi:hypothetical protein
VIDIWMAISCDDRSKQENKFISHNSSPIATRKIVRLALPIALCNSSTYSMLVLVGFDANWV